MITNIKTEARKTSSVTGNLPTPQQQGLPTHAKTKTLPLIKRNLETLKAIQLLNRLHLIKRKW